MESVVTDVLMVSTIMFILSSSLYSKQESEGSSSKPVGAVLALSVVVMVVSLCLFTCYSGV